MRRSGSHLAVLVLVGIPSLVTAAYAIRLLHQNAWSLHRHEQAERSHALLAEARVVDDSLLSSLETIRSQAVALLEKPWAILDSSILHTAELEVSATPSGGERIIGVKQAQKSALLANSAVPIQGLPGFEGATFFDNYLSAAMGKLDLAAIRRNSVVMLRVPRDSLHREQWLAFAFPIPGSRNVVLALVDPFEAFPLFRKWSERSAVSLDRAYLIATDGYVIVHSDRAFSGSDFSETGVFRDGVSEIFSREASASYASGNFSRIDQSLASTAILRVGKLPLAVVVEEPLPQQGTWISGDWDEVISEAFWLLVLAVVLSAAAARFLRKGFVVSPSGAAAEALPDLPLPPMPEVPLAEPQPETLPETAPEMPMATEMPTAPAEVQSAIERLRQNRELKDAEAPSQLSHRSRIEIEKFESEITRIKDVRLAATRLTAACARVFDLQTLFFGYHSGVHAAILHAHAGFPGGPDSEPGGMSFPILEPVLEKIFAIESKGSIAALGEFMPLGKLMSTHFPGRKFQAWALTGFAPSIRQIGGPRLIGVVVMLEPARPKSANAPQALNPWRQIGQQGALTRLFRATGLAYENTLLTQ